VTAKGEGEGERRGGGTERERGEEGPVADLKTEEESISGERHGAETASIDDGDVSRGRERERERELGGEEEEGEKGKSNMLPSFSLSPAGEQAETNTLFPGSISPLEGETGGERERGRREKREGVWP